jgi:proteasome assembly chaperone 3
MASAATAPITPDYTVSSAPYPAHTKTETTTIKGLSTTATAVNFADKIFITVTQDGRLAHWVRAI